jgi:hypothetical protein
MLFMVPSSGIVTTQKAFSRIFVVRMNFHSSSSNWLEVRKLKRSYFKLLTASSSSPTHLATHFLKRFIGAE